MQLRHPCENPKLTNLRDVAYAHESIRPGVLYRGGCLNGLSPEDAALLQLRLGIRTVIDLRTDREQKSEPDTPLQGAQYHAVPLAYGVKRNGLGLYGQILNHMPDLETAEAVIARAYAGMVTEQWGNVLRVLELIAEKEAPVLLHCRHGRDRTGLVEAILLRGLGIPYPDILRSFLLSNEYMRQKNAADFARMSAQMSDVQKAQLWCLFETREPYLRAALDAVTKPLAPSLLKKLHKRLTADA